MANSDGAHVWPPRASDLRIQEITGAGPEGSTPTHVFNSFRTAGYTGSLDDMWKQHLAALGITDVSEPFNGSLALSSFPVIPFSGDDVGELVTLTYLFASGITLPANGVQEDDTILVIFFTDNINGVTEAVLTVEDNVDGVTGWSEPVGVGDTVSDASAQVFIKNNMPAGITKIQANYNVFADAICLCIRIPSGIQVDAVGDHYINNSDTHNVASVTTSDKSVVLAIIAMDGDDTIPMTNNGSGWTKEYEAKSTETSGGSGVAVAIFSKEVDTAASGAHTITAAVADGGVTVPIAFKNL